MSEKENSQKRFEVVCVGNMVTDILIKGVKDDVMDRVEMMTEGVRLHTGGDALNEAVTCSRLGLRTALVGNLGADFFGGYVEQVLMQENIHTEGISFFSDCPTAVNVALIGDGGKRCILTAPITNMNRMELTSRGMDVVKEAGIVCFGSLFISASLNAEMVQSIYREAQRSGALTVADVSFRDPTEWEDKNLYDWIDGVDYFVPSYEEGCRITGLDDPEAIVKALLPHVRRAVVLKVGKDGCIGCETDGELFRTPAYLVDAIDTTGAGDNFVAGFLWGLAKGHSLKECCACACAVGGLSTTAVGANGAIKNEAQVLEFMSAWENRQQ